MDTTAHVKVFDAMSDGRAYTELISDPNVAVEKNETFLPKSGEPLLVIQYRKKEEIPPDLKAPILGF